MAGSWELGAGCWLLCKRLYSRYNTCTIVTLQARQSGDTYDAITSLQHKTLMTNVGSAGITSRPTRFLAPGASQTRGVIDRGVGVCSFLRVSVCGWAPFFFSLEPCHGTDGAHGLIMPSDQDIKEARLSPPAASSFSLLLYQPNLQS